VRFVYKHFPLSFHQNARPAAEAAEFARSRGKFWEMHAKIFENVNALNRQSPDEIIRTLRALGRETGLDENALEASVRSQAFRKVIDKDFEDGRKASVTGTPAIFINGRRLQRRDLPTIKAMIEEALRTGPPRASR
jgi:protein-disulfide isomerase